MIQTLKEPAFLDKYFYPILTQAQAANFRVVYTEQLTCCRFAIKKDDFIDYT